MVFMPRQALLSYLHLPGHRLVYNLSQTDLSDLFLLWSISPGEHASLKSSIEALLYNSRVLNLLDGGEYDALLAGGDISQASVYSLQNCTHQQHVEIREVLNVDPVKVGCVAQVEAVSVLDHVHQGARDDEPLLVEQTRPFTEDAGGAEANRLDA